MQQPRVRDAAVAAAAGSTGSVAAGEAAATAAGAGIAGEAGAGTGTAAAAMEAEGGDGAHDLSGLIRSAMWKHCSSVTNKVPLKLPPQPAAAAGVAGARAQWGEVATERQGAATSTSPPAAADVEDSREARVLAALWASIEDAVESFQRRFIARRFF